MSPARALTCGAAALWLAALGIVTLGGGRESRALAAQDRPAQEAFDSAVWREAFRRPDAIPQPPDNPATPEKVELGRRLFADTRLSGSNQVSCATCHQPELSFSDGIARRPGLLGEMLPRRTPPLWNLAYGRTFFWDGRAASLEAQASGPVENQHEMGGNMAVTARELAADPAMRSRFREAFPGAAEPLSERTITQALAAFERTLVSPPTRFDAWVAGDDKALAPEELAGLKLFVGKGNCVACHAGWRFSDEAFHDIGLPAATPPDRGRGAILGIAAADNAFKTPSLRERVWTGPYMHDGSVGSLEAAVAHYSGGAIARRPTLSGDLDPALVLTSEEQAALVAFLGTLSSEDPPRPQTLPARVQEAEGAGAIPVSTTMVGQKGRRFTPSAVRVKAGEALTIVNDDTRTHNVMLTDPRRRFTSEAQEPGDRVVVPFPEAGTYTVVCGIHPEMRLDVSVTAP